MKIGLEDKKGNEFFEGAIVEKSNELLKGYLWQRYRGKVVYRPPSFKVAVTHFYERLDYRGTPYEKYSKNGVEIKKMKLSALEPLSSDWVIKNV